MTKVLKTENKQEWLELRGKYIGGSDAAVIYLKSTNKGKPYEKNIIELWKEKSGLVEIKEIKEFENPRIDIGNELESYICRRFKNEYPQYNLIDTKNNYFVSDIPYIGASLDGLLEDKYGNRYVFEAKTAGESQKKYWTEESVPDSYYLQVQHYLFVTGLETAFIAVLFRESGEYQSYRIDRNDEQIKEMLLEYKEFWTCVENKIQPVVSEDDYTLNMMKKLYPESSSKTIELPDSLLNHITTYCQIEAKIKEYEEESEKHKTIIQAAMKDAEKATLGSFTVNWKTSMNIDEDKLKQNEPSVYSAYSRLKLDTALLRKEMKELVKSYLKAGARKFSIKVK